MICTRILTESNTKSFRSVNFAIVGQSVRKFARSRLESLRKSGVSVTSRQRSRHRAARHTDMGIASTLKAKAAKAKAAKGFLEKNVPIPAHFYAGQTEDDLMAPKKVILPFVLMLNLVLVAAFAAAMAYYSSPDSYLTDISIEPDYDFGAPAYNCTPLIADTHYGVRFNYDTCKALLVSEVPLCTQILFFLLTATTRRTD